jgi:hypothetical protein
VCHPIEIFPVLGDKFIVHYIPSQIIFEIGCEKMRVLSLKKIFASIRLQLGDIRDFAWAKRCRLRQRGWLADTAGE